MPGRSGRNANGPGDELVPIAGLTEGARPDGSSAEASLTARVVTLGSLTFVTEAPAAVVLGALGDLFGLDLAFAAGAVLLLSGLPLVLLLPNNVFSRLKGAWKIDSVTGS